MPADSLALDVASAPAVVAPDTVGSPDEARATVADLEQRLRMAEEVLDGFRPRRACHAFDAAAGEVSAKAALADLAADETAAAREVGDLTDALREARRRLEAAEIREDDRVDRQRFSAAIKLGVAFVEAAEEVDQALNRLVDACGKYAAIALELDKSSCLPQHAALAAGDSDGSRLSSAFRHAGAHQLYRGNFWAAATRRSAVGGPCRCGG